MAGARLAINLSEPASAELLRRIRELPSVLDIAPDARSGEGLPPTIKQITALLEESADVDETAFLLESLPGVRSVDDI